MLSNVSGFYCLCWTPPVWICMASKTNMGNYLEIFLWLMRSSNGNHLQLLKKAAGLNMLFSHHSNGSWGFLNKAEQEIEINFLSPRCMWLTHCLKSSVCVEGFALLQSESCCQVFGGAATLEVTVVVLVEEQQGSMRGGEPYINISCTMVWMYKLMSRTVCLSVTCVKCTACMW